MSTADRAIRLTTENLAQAFAHGDHEESRFLRGYVLRSLEVARSFDQLYEAITGSPVPDRTGQLEESNRRAFDSITQVEIDMFRTPGTVHADVHSVWGLTAAYVNINKTPADFQAEIDALKAQHQRDQAELRRVLVDGPNSEALNALRVAIQGHTTQLDRNNGHLGPLMGAFSAMLGTQAELDLRSRTLNDQIGALRAMAAGTTLTADARALVERIQLPTPEQEAWGRQRDEIARLNADLQTETAKCAQLAAFKVECLGFIRDVHAPIAQALIGRLSQSWTINNDTGATEMAPMPAGAAPVPGQFQRDLNDAQKFRVLRQDIPGLVDQTKQLLGRLLRIDGIVTTIQAVSQAFINRIDDNFDPIGNINRMGAMRSILDTPGRNFLSQFVPPAVLNRVMEVLQSAMVYQRCTLRDPPTDVNLSLFQHATVMLSPDTIIPCVPDRSRSFFTDGYRLLLQGHITASKFFAYRATDPFASFAITLFGLGITNRDGFAKSATTFKESSQNLDPLLPDYLQIIPKQPLEAGETKLFFVLFQLIYLSAPGFLLQLMFEEGSTRHRIQCETGGWNLMFKSMLVKHAAKFDLPDNYIPDPPVAIDDLCYSAIEALGVPPEEVNKLK